jgi:hypothetical protein
VGLASVVSGICGHFGQFRGVLGEVLGFEAEEDGHEGEVLDLGTGERERDWESVKKRKLGDIVLEKEVGKKMNSDAFRSRGSGRDWKSEFLRKISESGTKGTISAEADFELSFRLARNGPY